MPLWTRVNHTGRTSFGTIEGDMIVLHEGDIFANPRRTGQSIPRSEAKLLTPTTPSKMLGLVDNYHALVTKLGHAVPLEPLYFLKANNSFLSADEPIRTPKSYSGKVVFEGELGIVIGKRCRAVSEADADHHIFGYTCVNDVTAVDILNKDPGFAQWTRAKSFDTFGVFGPVIATDVDPSELVVRTVLNDQERQNYPVADAIFGPAKLVSLISHDLTLEAGDVIACGTSVGVGSMKSGSTVSVVIDGIGALTNRFE
ncbi:MAG TPA: fumarylacetoacetate hydrolase family protein [Burkholderiaceae bacterium]|nr:fumarylacetoacetate hydrolase family protein [Burkholderiaceae bacterium]